MSQTPTQQTPAQQKMVQTSEILRNVANEFYKAIFPTINAHNFAVHRSCFIRLPEGMDDYVDNEMIIRQYITKCITDDGFEIKWNSSTIGFVTLPPSFYQKLSST